VIGGGCLRRMIAAVVIVALLAGAYIYRQRLQGAWQDLRGTRQQEVTASPELAGVAEAKLDALRDGTSEYAALSAVELESLLQYRYQAAVPAFLGVPTIELQGERIRLRARVPVDKLPNVEGLGEAAAFLPDTTELSVAGRLLPLGAGRIAFAIEDVSAQRFPLPRRMVPRALERLGRRDEPGLPADAMALPLPPGIQAAYVRRDSLVLLARPAAN
jgi:hypothetical protein